LKEAKPKTYTFLDAIRTTFGPPALGSGLERRTFATLAECKVHGLIAHLFAIYQTYHGAIFRLKKKHWDFLDYTCCS
jgi:hypothetical protein